MLENVPRYQISKTILELIRQAMIQLRYSNMWFQEQISGTTLDGTLTLKGIFKHVWLSFDSNTSCLNLTIGSSYLPHTHDGISYKNE